MRPISPAERQASLRIPTSGSPVDWRTAPPVSKRDRHVVPPRPVRVVDPERHRAARDLVRIREDLVVPGQVERADGRPADEPDHRHTSGVDVGADQRPLDRSAAAGGSCSSQCAREPEADRRPKPVERQHLPADEHPEEADCRSGAPPCCRGRRAPLRTARARTSSSRRTVRPTHRRCRPSADRAARTAPSARARTGWRSGGRACSAGSPGRRSQRATRAESTT